MRYILNSAVITAPGTYIYRLCSVDQAQAFLKDGNFLSTVGYEETAAALTAITGIHIPLNRQIIKMKPGDAALVFRLTLPPGSNRLAVASKGHLTERFVLEHSEMGILTRIE